MKTYFLSFLVVLISVGCHAQQNFNVTVKNNSDINKSDAPVVIKLSRCDINVKSAVVKLHGNEVPCQLDDLDGDGNFDELCFLSDIGKNSQQLFNISLMNDGTPHSYPQRVYVEMLLKHPKNKTTNKQDTYITSLTVDGRANPYECLQHHGPAFESELNAYRIYFDERQTVDIYGKYKKGLELHDTQFYPDKEQKANGYGDDVLWVGSTFGLGTLRGWDGQRPTNLSDVKYRTERILARGPLRTIVEVKDEGWTTGNEGRAAINIITRYTLYAGHRDCAVDISFDRPVPEYEFATGIINIKNSSEMSDNKGLRGCWGTDWPVSEKDSAGYKRETVGLGICINISNIKKELPKDKDNYPYVVRTKNNSLHYDITFCSDNESFGFHSAKEWFDYLNRWKEDLSTPVTYDLKRIGQSEVK